MARKKAPPPAKKAPTAPPVDPTIGLIAARDICRALNIDQPNLWYWDKIGRFVATRFAGRVFYTREQYEQIKDYRNTQMKQRPRPLPPELL